MTKEDTLARLSAPMPVEVVGDLSTPEATLEYIGAKGKPKAEQRVLLQAFITGAPWARPILAGYVFAFQEMGLLD